MKIIKIDEVKGHVEFECEDGRVQRAQDLFASTAEEIKAKVSAYCEIYVAPTATIKVETAEIPKMRAVEGKAITLVAKAEVIVE